jgi:hypothetical protein
LEILSELDKYFFVQIPILATIPTTLPATTNALDFRHSNATTSSSILPTNADVQRLLPTTNTTTKSSNASAYNASSSSVSPHSNARFTGKILR